MQHAAEMLVYGRPGRASAEWKQDCQQQQQLAKKGHPHSCLRVRACVCCVFLFVCI